jgi:hypothetical protein
VACVLGCLAWTDLALLVIQWEVGSAAATARAATVSPMGLMSPTNTMATALTPMALVPAQSPDLGDQMPAASTPAPAGAGAGAGAGGAGTTAPGTDGAPSGVVPTMSPGAPPPVVHAPPSLDVVANVMVRHALITAETPELQPLSRRSIRVVEDVVRLRPNAILRFA